MNKHLLGLLILFLPIMVLSHETIQRRALNPDFVDYMSRKNNGEITGTTSQGKYLGEVPSPLLKSFDNYNASSVKGIPASYDLRTKNGVAWLTPVKNQGLEGACWAFATYAAI